MRRNRGGNDRGSVVLFITVVTTLVLGFATVLVSGTMSHRLKASQAEALAAEQRLVSKTTEGVLDAWMADQGDSAEVGLDAGAGREWMTPIGEQPCPDPSAAPPRNICWRIRADDPATPEDEDGVVDVTFNDPELRGGEAQRVAKDVTIEIAAGCYTNDPEDCQRTTSITRRYEQAVLFQYQLHYDTNTVPPVALYGVDEMPDPAICGTNPLDPTCDAPAVTYGLDGVPDDPAICGTNPLDPACDGYNQNTVIVFTTEDTLNGPVRTTLSEVLYCGEPSFYRVEVSGEEPPTASSPLDAASGCPPDPLSPLDPTDPLWLDENENIITPSPQLPDLLANGSLVYGGNLNLPGLDAAGYSATLLCDVVDFDYQVPLPGSCPRNVEGGDLISPNGSDITIHELILDGSVTVYASGDIIICGNIEAHGSNLAGGPNVIALITEGDVILDPSGQATPACGEDLPTPLATVGTIIHDLDLLNVAVLAPEGAIYARNWHLPHDPAGGPTLHIEGSIAAEHLGLYGIPDPATGTVTAGWAKHFTYPTDFWLARPPWWPGYDDGIEEWAPVG